MSGTDDSPRAIASLTLHRSSSTPVTAVPPVKPPASAPSARRTSGGAAPLSTRLNSIANPSVTRQGSPRSGS